MESIVDPTENVSHVINTNIQQNTRPASFPGGQGRSANRRENGRGWGNNVSTLNRTVRELVI